MSFSAQNPGGYPGIPRDTRCQEATPPGGTPPGERLQASSLGGVPPGKLDCVPACWEESLPASWYTDQLVGRTPSRRAGFYKIKDGLIQLLADEQRAVRQVSGQAIAVIGAVELPLGMWPGLIGQLLQIINNAEGGVPLRQATLQAIGYLCESTLPEVLAAQSNEILTAVVSGARKEEPSTEVQLAAVNALYNSLEFVRANFDREVRSYTIFSAVPACREEPLPTSWFKNQLAGRNRSQRAGL
ncbi:karyopherin beta [Puccinia graminis f. sp. tritici]|uniref:Karyopherin beta n=1 Tax=Puccinia graminis f. sp. tritici TaxID=56615 RepID=A0A5B0MG28_PUCGR|nr:karyopherin beta [Puccinia graminis f. sp. tritici]KAA1091526.1 karyopherin beta [Puccinia graminis f. sp. tritici]